jgi:hypothetical protein
MKKLLVLALSLSMAGAAYAQGTINFANRVVADGLDAPVFGLDGNLLDGDRYMAEILAGPSADSLEPISTAPFRTGTGVGYWNPGSPATRVLDNVAPGAEAFILIRAWDTDSGATFGEAAIRGEAPIFSVVTGGAGSPPSLPAVMMGLEGFTLVPEPSTIMLALLGAGALFLRRFRK